jgi:chemotaxis family two-component system response regulator Rcp1
MADKFIVLLVEDNPADADLTRETFESSKILCEIYETRDGIEAMAYLRRQGPYAEAPRPNIILLDLNLPRKNGREVLADIKSDPGLRHIPVIVLTSSGAEEDIFRSYDLQACAYVTKPVDLAGFSKIVKAIESFWFTVVTFPNHDL